MRRLLVLAAVAATAAVALAAAPASAQTADDRSIPPHVMLIAAVKAKLDSRPCTPALPANDAVTCGFDLSVWSLGQGEWAAGLAEDNVLRHLAEACAALGVEHPCTSG